MCTSFSRISIAGLAVPKQELWTGSAGASPVPQPWLTVLKQELVVANFVTETSKFCDNLSRYFALFCPWRTFVTKTSKFCDNLSRYLPCFVTKFRFWNSMHRITKSTSFSSMPSSVEPLGWPLPHPFLTSSLPSHQAVLLLASSRKKGKKNPPCPRTWGGMV